MNGLFLVALGLMWPRLALSPRLLATTFWLARQRVHSRLEDTSMSIDEASAVRIRPSSLDATRTARDTYNRSFTLMPDTT